MPKYTYAAKDTMGNKVEDTAEAGSPHALISSLKAKNMTVITIEEAKPQKLIKKRLRRQTKTKGKVKLVDIAIFSRQLATMLEAGVPVVDSIRDIGEQIENVGFRQIIEGIAEKLEKGKTLSEAISAYPRVFSPLFISLTRAGEESGALTEVLSDMSSYLDDQVALRRKVTAATSYPIFIACFFVIAVSFVTFFLIPRFRDIFASFGAELPLFTKIVLGVSEFALKNIWFEIVGICLLILFFKIFSKSENGRYHIDRLKLRVPIFGKLFQKVSLARFARTLATLLQGGVPIIASLDIVGGTSGNVLIQGSLKRIQGEIVKGSTLGEELRKDPLFPTMLVRMVKVGEDTGKINEMLNRLSSYYQEELNAAIVAMTSIIEPLLIVLLGGVVGVVVVAIYFPIFKLASTMH